MARKGIVLAGGSGTRLYPVTLGTSKQLCPIYNKPMIYYPLCALMLAGLREILIIATREDQPQFQRLLGDGSQWGLSLEFSIQEKPEGLAQALIIAEPFLAGSSSALVLGDNIFFGHGFPKLLESANGRPDGATVFAYYVSNPSDFGVVQFDDEGAALGLEEKPQVPKSNYAVTGLYFYDETASARARSLHPSARGELEITDLNRRYLEDGKLNVEIMGRGYAWLDTGSHSSMLQAANFVEAVEQRQGLMVCCPEEVAYRNRWISDSDLLRLAEPLSKSEYGRYLKRLVSPR